MPFKHAIATTTNDLPGYSIEGYVGVVTAHVVAGTGIFSDIAGGFRDFFGGRSKSYQKQLGAIDQEVIDQLLERADKLGANAVIGLRIDHDEVTGGGKQMFMVTASGTAVIAAPEANVRSGLIAGRTIGSDEILERQTKRYLIDRAEAGYAEFSEEDWDFITRHSVSELKSVVAQLAVERIESAAHEQPSTREHEAYFRALSSVEAAETLYPLAVSDNVRVRNFARELIAEMELLDLERVGALLGNPDHDIRKRGLALVDAHKESYSKSDAEAFERIAHLIEGAFPNRWSEQTKSTFTGKERTVAACPCGSTHDPDFTYCPQCGENRRGFRRNEKKPEAYAATVRGRKEAIEEAVLDFRS